MQCRRGDWPAERVLCLANYEGAARQAVIKMKQPNSDTLGIFFGRLLAQWSATLIDWQAVDLVVPVPQYWVKRLKVRHNSAEILASQVASYHSKKLAIRGVKRIRLSSKQGMLTHNERAKNVSGAFAVCSGIDWNDKRVVIIDDIVTSGSTAAAMCRPIQKAGATSVIVLAVARGTRNQNRSTRATFNASDAERSSLPT